MPSLKLLESVDDGKESSKRKKRKEAHSNEDKRSNANDVNQKRKAKRTKSSSSTTSGEKKNNTKMDSSKGRNNYTHTKANLDPEATKSTSTTTSDGKKTKSLKMDEGRPPEYPPGSFVYYQNESRPQFKVNNPNLSCSELSQAMHEQFKLLTEEEKKPYYRMRNEALERYNEEMILYKASSKRICDGGTSVQVNDNNIKKMVGTNAHIREKGGENTNGKEVVHEDTANVEASAGGREDVDIPSSDMKVESVNVLIIKEKSISTLGSDGNLCKSTVGNTLSSDDVNHDGGNEMMNTKPASTTKESKGKENLDEADSLAFRDPQYSSNTPTSIKVKEDQGVDCSTASCTSSDSILEKGLPFGRSSTRKVCGMNGSDVSGEGATSDTHKKDEDKKQQSRESETIVTLIKTKEQDEVGKSVPEPKRVSFDQMEDKKSLGKKSLLKKPNRVSVEPDIKVGQQSSSTSPKWTLKLNPMSKDAAAAVLLDRGISYSEPIYLCPGGPDEYNVARNIISLSVGLDNPVSKVELGRSKTTGIIWSALSRKLCDVLLVFSSDSCPTASLIMKKPEQEVAVYINGHELNVGVGEKTVLKHGTILSLYGPTGFAYRVEISSDAENEVPLKRTR